MPVKSQEVYESVWLAFTEFRTRMNLANVAPEKAVFAYLAMMFRTDKWQSPATLWNRFSILSTMLFNKEMISMDGTNIERQVKTWIKQKTATFYTKQSEMFAKEDVARFVTEAPASFLQAKLVLLVGCFTGLRCESLTSLLWSHLDLRNPGEVRIYVNFETKTDKRGEGMWYMLPGATANTDLDPYPLFRNYEEIIRKRDAALVAATARLWTRMDSDNEGRFTVYRGSPRGVTWISGVPAKVASWLNLSTPHAYTGHCMRRTCAQWLADSGQSEPEIMHFFGWKSTNMVKVYTKHSIALKQKAASSLDLECRSPWNQDVMREQRATTVSR